MTKKEVKDEMKDTEGKPEGEVTSEKDNVKWLLQMIEKVKDADVVITNPEHFSVAVAYEPSGRENAPIVIAKGIDHLALKIRERAKNNSIFLFEAPVLSGSLFHN